MMNTILDLWPPIYIIKTGNETIFKIIRKSEYNNIILQPKNLLHHNSADKNIGRGAGIGNG